MSDLREALKIASVELWGAWQILSAICETDTSVDRRKARDRAWAAHRAAAKALEEAAS